MIHINKISETSLNKLKVCTRLIENEFLDNVYNEIVVFTDEVEIIRFNLKRILNICGIYINLQILPFSDKLNYKNKISENTIIFEIIECFGLYKLNFLDKTSYLKYNSSDDFIEVKTKIYDSIIEGEIL